MALQLQHVMASLNHVEALATAVRKDAVLSGKVRCSEAFRCMAEQFCLCPQWRMQQGSNGGCCAAACCWGMT